MLVEDIKAEVRIILDENKVNTALIESDNDTLDLNAIISQKIAHGIRSVEENAPSHLIDNGVSFISSITWDSGTVGKGMGYMTLPDDFLRLVIFKMSDWRRPVLVPIGDTDPLYFLQKSKFNGIKGGIDKPVVALTTNSTGKILEFYSCNGGSTVTIDVAKYLPIPKIEDGSIDVSTLLYTPCLYYIAGLVSTTLGETDRAKNLFDISNSYLK